MKQFLFLIFLLWSNLLLWAQDSTSKKSDWNEYYSFHANMQIADAGNRIYSANSNAIFYLQKSDNTLHHLSKNNGLSDVGITSIAADPTGVYLIVGYENGNVDIIKNNQTTNIVDIKSKLMSSKKSINHIVFLSNKAFLATGFGIVVLDYINAQLVDTYILSPIGEYVGVNRLFADSMSSSIYAATMKGVFSAKYGLSNLADNNNWTKYTAFGNDECNAICYFDSSLYVNKINSGIDSFFVYKNGVKALFKTQYRSLRYLHSYKDKIVIIGTSRIDVFDSKLLLKQVIDSNNVASPEFHDASIDNDGTLWYNEKVRGLFHSSDINALCPQSPVSDFISSIRLSNEYLILTHGVQWRYFESKISFYNLDFTSWMYSIDWSYTDPMNSVSYENEKLHFFVGTWGRGVIEYNDWWNPIKKVSTTNNSNFGGDYVNDIKIDTAKNVFVYSARSNYPFSVYTKRGLWFKWNYTNFTKVDDQSELFIDGNNWKWAVAYDGIFVFNDKETPLDPKDDDTKYIPLTDNLEESISASAKCMAIDLNNVLWVGTISGLAYYSNANQIFGDSKPRLSRNKVTVNGVVDYLLASEVVTSIAIDAANRKWIGTNSGLFLVSSNGTEVLQHFTVDNSPLPSNSISCLKIIADKSELMIGTYNGMVSYNIGIKEAKKDFSEISIYPNPVKHDFTGLVKFEGLMENTTIKLLDINGNLVYETVSEGGTAFWDGKNLVGERVASGVYVVILVNSDQTQKKVSKIIFIH
jgi:hypothetical protein